MVLYMKRASMGHGEEHKSVMTLRYDVPVKAGILKNKSCTSVLYDLAGFEIILCYANQL